MTVPNSAVGAAGEKSELHAAREQFLAATAAKREEESRPEAPKTWRDRLGVIASIVVLSVTLAYLLIARPAWVFPQPLPTPVPTVASIERALAGVASLIESRAATGVPASVSEVGLLGAPVRYERLSDRRFSVSMAAGVSDVTLTVDLDAPPEARRQFSVVRITP